MNDGDMYQLAHKVIWYVALVLSTSYVACRGGRDEKRFALGMVIISAVTGIMMSFAHGVFVVGIGALLGIVATMFFGVIALRTDRWWPLWATAFQVVSNTTLLAPLVDPQSRLLAGYIGSVGLDYLTLAALVIGTRLEGGGLCRNHTLSLPQSAKA